MVPLYSFFEKLYSLKAIFSLISYTSSLIMIEQFKNWSIDIYLVNCFSCIQSWTSFQWCSYYLALLVYLQVHTFYQIFQFTSTDKVSIFCAPWLIITHMVSWLHSFISGPMKSTVMQLLINYVDITKQNFKICRCYADKCWKFSYDVIDNKAIFQPKRFPY